MASTKVSVVVLISGSGSNLQAILDASQTNYCPINIKAVISNRPLAKGLERAKHANIPAIVIDHNDYNGRDDFDEALIKQIDHYQPELVVLAGFMRILTHDFVSHYTGRLINIHPSLLPNFPGLNTHERAVKSGVEQHGASVHFVTTEVDGGPIILQASVSVKSNDTAKELAQRVLHEEHLIYPLAIKWFAEKRLVLDNNKVLLDHVELPKTGLNYAQVTENQ